MLRPVDLRHLRYFQAVAEELSYSKASRRLHVAQPALSRGHKRHIDRNGGARELGGVVGGQKGPLIGLRGNWFRLWAHRFAPLATVSIYAYCI